MIRLQLDHGLLLMLLLSFAGPMVLHGQEEEVDQMKLIEQVAKLQRKLNAEDVADREQAEQDLSNLGVAALDHLEPAPDTFSSEARERLGRVRKALETLATKAVTQPSRVTISGSLTLDAALAAIRKQTGNEVVLHDGAPDELRELKLELELDGATFWQAMTAVNLQSGCQVSPYTGDAGKMTLTLRAAADDDPARKVFETLPRSVDSVFEIAVTRVTANRQLLQPQLNGTAIELRVRWEPRITPISFAIPAKSIQLMDEFDRPIEIPNREAVYSASVQPEIPELQITIPIALIDRQVQVIKSFEAELKTILPGREEKFTFKNLGRLGAGTRQTKAGVVVGFEGIRKNEDLYGVTVSAGFEDPDRSLESHLSWIYENPMQLIDEDGTVWPPLATESIGQTENRASIQYYFARDPAPMTLVYQTPAAIVSTPISISIRNIPLP